MLRHDKGFENEARFWMILCEALADCPVIKSRTVYRVITHFAPEFTAHLFEISPCVRKLRYIGFQWVENDDFFGDTSDDMFTVGEIYESIDFNGATYTIKGYKDGKRRIGCAYFERVT